MGSVEVMLSKLCPNGVDYKLLGEVTTWDKKFNGTDKALQPKTVKFKHVSASKLKQIAHEYGDIRLLATGVFEGYAHIDEVDESIINVGEVISIPSGGAADIKYHDGKFIDSGNLLAVSSDSTKYSLKYIWYWLLANNHHIQDRFRGSAVQHPDMPSILKLEVPIPPLPVQEEIVRILDSFTELIAELKAELAARKKQYEFYREDLLKLEGVDFKALSEVATVQNGRRVTKSTMEASPGKYTVWHGGEKPMGVYSKSNCEANTTLIANTGSIGYTQWTDEACWCSDACTMVKSKDTDILLDKYIYYYLMDNNYTIQGYKRIAGIPTLDVDRLRKFRIPIPPIEVQEEIVEILDTFTELIAELTAEIALRQKQYEFYREKLLTF